MRKLGMDMSNDRAEVSISGYLTLGQVRQVIGGPEEHFEVELDNRLKGTRRRLPGSSDINSAMRQAALGVLWSARHDNLDGMEGLLSNTSVAKLLDITEDDIPADLPPEPSRVGAQSTHDAE
jgi:hypothetical protein